MNAVDISPILQALIALASAAIMACVPLVTIWIRKHLKIAANTQAAAQISHAVQVGAQVAIDEMNKVAKANQTVEIQNAAVAKGVSVASQIAKDATKVLQIDQTKLTAMVGGAMTKTIDPPQPKEGQTSA